ncbi:BgTH12-02507 [Blumeria graminis f. sp. triticale]|uniref:Bgt-4957 n=3 Tax=Blumeria graminis TaxID=34373 RepID=A0A9X9MGS7_BLUGR|nr:hypothetical protein BGT96224_4957 [Blumeria graminis f. sp. tritici 96224]CAD6502269.1 BgTH12-02507 [Blumeria graminis f. sp. triticale]VDB86337.1 Bgt-4957 [Blumeria graminis f. sp. tritici]
MRLIPKGLTRSSMWLSSQIYFREAPHKSQRPYCHQNNQVPNRTSRIWDQNPVIVRDACTCHMCVDGNSGQKNFRTTDIPRNITPRNCELVEGGVQIQWKNDIPGFESHKTFLTHLQVQSSEGQIIIKDVEEQMLTWDKFQLNQSLPALRFNYQSYLDEDHILHQVLCKMQKWGIVFFEQVPESEKAVEAIAGRLGPLRNTFYGQTWDVKSIPAAHNVAYTNKYLGLHQDLLYMKIPPGMQILHCLQNSCQGGESLFSDAFRAAEQISSKAYKVLSEEHIFYHYHKVNEHYFCSHPIFENDQNSNPNSCKPIPSFVNYSPPFQASFPWGTRFVRSQKILQSLTEFEEIVESTRNLFEYKLKPGECVMFNNRRILHGRKAFNTTDGKRWLKGCYLDTEVFMSRARTVHERFRTRQESVEANID